jgi:hypothetical protein
MIGSWRGTKITCHLANSCTGRILNCDLPYSLFDKVHHRGKDPVHLGSNTNAHSRKEHRSRLIDDIP